MRTRAGIILQARVASSRLPGKALEMLGSRTMLEHCLRRLVSGGVAHVALATTTNREDDALAAIASNMGVPVLRGEVDDVLGRFAATATALRFDPIVRATADNPAVDLLAAGRVLTAMRAGRVDYVAEEGLPLGAGVEAFTYAALSRTAMAAELPADREHVTTFIKRNPQTFAAVMLPAPAPLRRPDLRFTVDTREDLEYMRMLFARTGSDTPTLRQLVDAAGRNTESEVA
jgi:spore coat polysaccharide biosynthesis protein SpsF